MRFTYTPLLLGLLVACQPTDHASAPAGAATAHPAPPPPLAVGGPQLYAGSDWVLYPLPLPSTSRTRRDEYGSSYSSSDPAHYWQVLFYNARTGQLRQLSEGRKLLIRSISPARDEERPGQGPALAFSYAPSPYTSQNLLLYAVTTTDFDRDGQLTDLDPAYLFVSTQAGEAFRQVSPDSLHVTDWKFQPTTGRLLLTTVHDGNHNHHFDDDTDEALPYVLDLAGGQQATPVLPAGLVRTLQAQRQAAWLPKPAAE